MNTIRDLGVEISRDMKFHVHINQIVKSATAIANQIHRCFMLKNKTFLTKMFKIFVRPKLEYASQVWNPVYIGDINRLERVQRSFTRKIPGLNKCSYAKRLEILDLPSLELRRIHLDLIFTYKLLHNYFKIDYTKFLNVKTTRTRGHRLTLAKPVFKKDFRKHFYSNRVINVWNSLPASVALASSPAAFKKLLCTDSINKKLCTLLRGEDFDSPR